jgi:glycosyltransferase 2 family protein
MTTAPLLRRERFAAIMPALRVARFVVAVGIVVAMAVVAVRYVPSRSLTWGLLVLALPPTLVWWTLLARGWAILAGGAAGREDMGVWCRTQVLRYLPGGIWAPTSRVVLVGGTTVDRLATVAAENIVSLCAALALGGAALALSGRPLWGVLLAALAVPAAGLRIAGDRTRLDRGRTRRATANAIAAFVGYMAAAVLVQAAVSGWHEPLLVAGGAGVSWAVGLVVVFTPGGLGARELAYAGLLAPSFPHADLAAAAVVLRALTIVAELLVLVVLGRPPTEAPAAATAGGAPASEARSAGEEPGTMQEPDGRLTVLGHKVPGA